MAMTSRRQFLSAATAFTRDVGGRFAFRGFKGEYELEATANGKTVKKGFHISPDLSSSVEITFA